MPSNVWEEETICDGKYIRYDYYSARCESERIQNKKVKLDDNFR